MKILLDYVFPISAITSIPAASTSFLKQVCIVAKPKAGQEGNVGTLYQCANMAAVAARTDNDNAQQCFDEGMTKVFILLANDLDIGAFLDANQGKFFTVLVSDDYSDSDIGDDIGTPAVAASKVLGDLTFTAKKAGTYGNDITVTLVDDVSSGSEYAHAVGKDITVHIESTVTSAQIIKDVIEDSTSANALITVAIAMGEEASPQTADDCTLESGAQAIMVDGTGITLGAFKGVTGISSDDDEFCAEQAVKERRCAFFIKTANGATNLFAAFGSLLAASSWSNQQYIEMPVSDDVSELSDANSLFDDKVSFVIDDDEFGTRLALFACGGKAIVAPYILKNLMIDLQSKALSWIALNQPDYTKVEATLLEDRLNLDVIDALYIREKLISAGKVEISLLEDNFVASGDIQVTEPRALWRIMGELTAQ